MNDRKYSIREMRLLSGISAQKAAEEINVCKISIYNKEKEPQKISLYEAIKLCKLYGFELKDIDEDSIKKGE